MVHRSFMYAHPATDAISVVLEELGDRVQGEGQIDLNVTCNVSPEDQPFPPIHTYAIKKDEESVSASKTVVLSPRPDTCANITCIGNNGQGLTTHPPRNGIIDIEFDERLDNDGRAIVIISCHVSDADQPFPPLHNYDIKVGNESVSNSSSSSFTLSTRPDRCTEVTCTGANTLDFTSTTEEFCPSDPPGDDIMSLRFEEQRDGTDINIEITCHIEALDQPTPPIDTFEISVDGQTISLSANPSVVLQSRPNRCINVRCKASNRHGSTFATELICHKEDIIDVQFSERVGMNNGKIYTVVCHIDEGYQPTPGIHTFLITADNVTLSSSRSPSTAFTPRADGGTEVSCTGWNDFGSTTATKTFCPSGEL
ncbi:uncharacterized protein [Diadema antillarum]|uniref:uncharacterized protein n=1 Tax=Diadema antillarum TaxID=105358 RepID=UPI003A83606A